MKKAIMALVLAFLTIWIGLASSPGSVYAGGPTGPLTPPTIAISAETTDCESIRFLVEIQARGNTLSYFEIKCLVGETEIVKLVKLIKNPDQVTYPSTYHIIIGDLPSDTEIRFKAVLTYPAGSITTSEASARTALVPSISVSSQSVYSEGIFLIVQIDLQGHVMDDWRIEYYTETSADWSIVRGSKVGTNIYHVNITGISPQTPVHFLGALDYQTNIARRSILTDEFSTTTNSLPLIRAVEQGIGFDQADIFVEIEPNNNPIYTSWFEYQVPDISNEWTVVGGTGNVDESFAVHLADLSPGQTVIFRSSLSYSTGGEIIAKSIDSDTSVIRTNSILSGDYQLNYNATDKTVDYILNGTFNYTKRNPADFTHLDLGFVWSENANPQIGQDSHQLSLGGDSLPVHQTCEAYPFLATAMGLKTGKTYYYRAYVIGKNGQIYYGDARSCFLPTMTRAPEPSITKAATAPSESSIVATASDPVSPSDRDSQPTPDLTSATTSAGSESGGLPSPEPGGVTTAASSTQPGNPSATGLVSGNEQQQPTDHL